MAVSVVGWRRRLVRMAVAAAAGAVAVAVVNAGVYLQGRAGITAPAGARQAQAALVLGALVFPDGRVSGMVADRLETAYDLYSNGKVAKILLTGDHGQADYDEVNAMRRYLERRGVPPEDIFMDHAGFSTYDSMYRARDVFQVKSALVVTQRFHLPRAIYIARGLGLEAQGVVADRFVYPGLAYYEFREIGARLKAFSQVLLRSRPVYLGPLIPITGDGRQTHDQPL